MHIFYRINLFSIMFLFIIGLFIASLIKLVREWSFNNAQPVLTVIAKIVGKRTNTTTSNNHANEHIHSSTSTIYYITFQVESGDRMEFNVSGKEYGMVAEEDMGELTFQGTRYHSFKRIQG